MLIFIDESYSTSQTRPTVHALAGFAISESSYRRLVAVVHQLKERYFETADGLSEEALSELRTRRIACSGDPKSVELKATKLLTAKAAKFHLETKSAQSILLVEDLISHVLNLGGVVFGVISEPESINEIQSPGSHLPVQVRALLERVDLWMKEQHKDEHAALIFDAIHSRISADLNLCASDFLFRHREGQRMRNLVPTIFWVDSASSPGSQVADIIAHLLMSSALPSRERKPLTTPWSTLNRMSYFSEDGRTRSIRRLKKKQQEGV